MPSIKDFNKKNKEAEQQEFDLNQNTADKGKSKKIKKRRPHLENSNHQANHEGESDELKASDHHHKSSNDVEVDSVHTHVDLKQESHDDSALKDDQEHDQAMNTQAHADEPQEKVIKITDLPGYWGLGAGMVKATAPKVVDVIENVATEWVNDGNFYNVPVGHPIAQYAVGEALRNAKKVEKKLEEKGVFMMAQIGVDYLKSKIKK